MIEDRRIFLFVRDFTGRGADRFFWYTSGQLVEVGACDISNFSGAVVCHDFWLIRDALFEKAGALPRIVVDLDELRIATSGIPADRIAREKTDITASLEAQGANQEVCSAYKRMFNKVIPFDPEVVAKVAAELERLYLTLVEKAQEAGEAERFFNVEVPIYQLLQSAMASGIPIDTRRLSEMRAEAEHSYFVLLKNYSAKHDMPLETPSRASLENRLRLDGFEMDDVSIEYLLEYVPHRLDFGGETIALQEADSARRVLSSLTLSTTIVRPVVDVFGSRTSRIHVRSPGLQNLPKKYRRLIKPREGAKLSYVDFDQYEVGIMAALSGDAELLKLYAAGDMYDLFATTHLGLVGNRKAAKQLFLSYAYGMSRKSLVDAAVSLGVDRQRAKTAFKLFDRYEGWKKSVWSDFQANGRVTTLQGNIYKRDGHGQLSGKEQRSAVSQVVQGTASLIFKRALLAVGKLKDVAITLPMHDALLFEHTLESTPSAVVAEFKNAMTTSLDGRVKGKASLTVYATG